MIFSGYNSFFLETGRWFSPGTAVSYLRQIGDFLRIQQFLTWDRSVIFSGYTSFLLETGRWFSPGTPVSYLRQVGDFLRVQQFLTWDRSVIFSGYSSFLLETGRWFSPGIAVSYPVSSKKLVYPEKITDLCSCVYALKFITSNRCIIQMKIPPGNSCYPVDVLTQWWGLGLWCLTPLSAIF
jgi:hypothetical protein